MNDFERQLRETMSAMVADAEPPPAVMEQVRRRHRRRNARLAATAAVIIAIAVAPVINLLRAGAGQPGNGHASGRLLFPGGGRMLLEAHGDLKWLYPDGRTVQIASGFAGAMPAGGKLLAWKHANPPGASRFLPHGCFDPDCTRIHDLSYYTMNFDGSGSKLVLPAEPPAGKTAFQYENAQLAPDGSRLAYISQELRNGTTNIFLGKSELWSLDLATGHKTDLGPYYVYTPFAWRDNTTILADSPDGRSIQLVNAQDGTRSTYLTAADPRLVSAYGRARPGAGPPASISLEGWSPGPSALAVSLDARVRLPANTDRPAVFLVQNNRVLTFAPSHSKWITLTMRLSASGVFLLNSRTGNCDCPDLWNSATYAGAMHSQRLSRLPSITSTWRVSAVNPEGTVIALGEGGGLIDVVPVPSPACDQEGKCLHFQMKQLSGRGTLLAWEP
jgi:hypothetical protein